MNALYFLHGQEHDRTCRRCGIGMPRRHLQYMVVACLLAAVAAACARQPSGQPSARTSPMYGWHYVQLAKSGGPRPRFEPALAYDPVNRGIVLLGVSTRWRITAGNTSHYDKHTWLWSGHSWKELAPATTAWMRWGGQITYDPATHGIMLLSVNRSVTAPIPRKVHSHFTLRVRTQLSREINASQTWIWNGTTWRRLSPATSPTAQSGQSMAYDAATGQVVMVGGIAQAFSPTISTTSSAYHVYLLKLAMNITWLWNGRDWTEDHTPSPPVLGNGAIAYDAAAKQVVYFTADCLGRTCDPGQTWTWNGSTWTRQHPIQSPQGRLYPSMAYDPVTKQVILFGGSASFFFHFGNLRGTWAWNGVTWSKLSLATSPPTRIGASMTYDEAIHEIVLFGGTCNLKLCPGMWTLKLRPPGASRQASRRSRKASIG